jgi:hypothetical protein
MRRRRPSDREEGPWYAITEIQSLAIKSRVASLALSTSALFSVLRIERYYGALPDPLLIIDQSEEDLDNSVIDEIRGLSTSPRDGEALFGPPW